MLLWYVPAVLGPAIAARSRQGGSQIYQILSAKLPRTPWVYDTFLAQNEPKITLDVTRLEEKYIADG